ncbi:hypothetical protein FA15DRAFT_739276 [Coprinopsis marcescibilis]|uniref:Uncharacterized protein n=1 Tax=Coprinopsis marcescibilis TaxID=230819 RepID=A0A5C3KW14_COPMA|nr:hypothetical protein FA15DRAFT_739276 [Coprinopsis marcescibilis]
MLQASHRAFPQTSPSTPERMASIIERARAIVSTVSRAIDSVFIRRNNHVLPTVGTSQSNGAVYDHQPDHDHEHASRGGDERRAEASTPTANATETVAAVPSQEPATLRSIYIAPFYERRLTTPLYLLNASLISIATAVGLPPPQYTQARGVTTIELQELDGAAPGGNSASSRQDMMSRLRGAVRIPAIGMPSFTMALPMHRLFLTEEDAEGGRGRRRLGWLTGPWRVGFTVVAGVFVFSMLLVTLQPLQHVTVVSHGIPPNKLSTGCMSATVAEVPSQAVTTSCVRRDCLANCLSVSLQSGRQSNFFSRLRFPSREQEHGVATTEEKTDRSAEVLSDVEGAVEQRQSLERKLDPRYCSACAMSRLSCHKSFGDSSNLLQAPLAEHRTFQVKEDGRICFANLGEYHAAFHGRTYSPDLRQRHPGVNRVTMEQPWNAQNGNLARLFRQVSSKGGKSNVRKTHVSLTVATIATRVALPPEGTLPIERFGTWADGDLGTDANRTKAMSTSHLHHQKITRISVTVGPDDGEIVNEKLVKVQLVRLPDAKKTQAKWANVGPMGAADDGGIERNPESARNF